MKVNPMTNSALNRLADALMYEQHPTLMLTSARALSQIAAIIRNDAHRYLKAEAAAKAAAAAELDAAKQQTTEPAP